MRTPGVLSWESLRGTTTQDVVLAAMLGVISLVSLWSRPAAGFRDPDVLGVLLVAVASVAVAFRSRFPVGALLASLGAAVWLTALSYNHVSGIATLVILYSVAVSREIRVSLPAAAITFVTVGVVLAAGPLEPTPADWIANALVTPAAWVLGRSVRLRRAHQATVERGRRAEDEAREARTRSRVVEERSRVAREMQDLVAHNLTEITVQVAAARRLMDREPDRAREILLETETAGRAALEEIRRVLDMLSRPDDVADLRPQPGLADIEQLVAQERAGGAEVSFSSDGAVRPVPAGVALSAYRVVEEALRNARSHADGAPVDVTVSWAADRLAVGVLSGAGTGPLSWEEQVDHTTGGLARLRSRVAVYGGEFTWGRRRDGGFRLAASFPLNETARAR